MSESLKNKTVKGVVWSAIDRFSSQGIQFIFSILIARLLLPEDYGVVAMLNIFLAVSQAFIDSGFGRALIRKIDRTETDFSTVFYFNIVVAVILYGVLWLVSPSIARFYETPLLESVTRVVSLTLILDSFSGIQNAKLSINIDFKSRAIISVLTTVLTGAVGLWMAYSGYGVWALAIQSVLFSALRSILLWTFVRWMPKLVFSWESFKELFSFGSKLLASGLLDTLYNNIYTLVIGKAFSATSLGVYSKADTLAKYPSSNISSVLQSVTFPVLSAIQNDEGRLSNTYRIFLRISAFVVFPLMVGLASVADPMIRLILTNKWAGVITYLQIICFSMMWYPIHAINLNVLEVKGRSDYFLKLEIIKKVLGVVTLCVTIPMGLTAMCWGRVFTSVVCLPLNTYYTKKIIGYGFRHQMKDLMPILIHSLVMGVVAYGATLLVDGSGLKLLTGVCVGAIYYIAGAYIFKFSEMNEILEILKLKK